MFSTLKQMFGMSQSDGDLVARVLRYRRIGSGDDGIHMLRAPEIDDLDYALMRADNTCATINATGKDAITGQWFAIKKGSDLSKKWIGNSHGSSDDGGKTFYNESGYLSIPRPEYQVSVEEVVWHHQRVTQLRQQGVEQPERVRIMTDERKNKPWMRQAAA